MAENTQQLNIEEKDDYLSVTFPPYQSVQQMEAHINAVYDAVDKSDCRKLLIDLRATRKKVPVMELYELCIYLVSKFGSVHPKIAVMSSPEAVYPDRFGENVVRNRGLDLIRFVGDEKEAMEWLLGGKPALRK